MADAAASGAYDLPRRDGSDHVTPVDGVTATVMTRLDSTGPGRTGGQVNATDPWFLTEAEIAGRRQVLEYVRFLVDRVPGYEAASWIGMGTQITMIVYVLVGLAAIYELVTHKKTCKMCGKGSM